MRKLHIINVLLCTLAVSLSGCSEKTEPDNNSELNNVVQDTAAVKEIVTDQTTENIPMQTSSVSSLSEDSSVTVTEHQKIEKLTLGPTNSGAITEDGTLYMWGDGDKFKLGNGEFGIADTPLKIMDNVNELYCGENSGAAITIDGSLYMWGAITPFPRQENALYKTLRFPEKIMDNVKYASIGLSHAAVIKNDNSLYMWGPSSHGQLGNGINDIYEYPDTPVKIMDDVRCVSLGRLFSTAVTFDGSLYTWGWNKWGQLGNGKSGEDEFEAEPVKIMDNVQYACTFDSHSAAITEDGSLYMWGINDFGQLGNGKSGEDEFEAEPVKIMDNVKYVSTGCGHSAAITEDGSLYMWGWNDSGQLGNGEHGVGVQSDVPVKIMDNVKSVSLGNEHSGALTEDGELYMWGNNAFNNVVDVKGDNGNVYVPTRIDITGN
jgi:alpha-tubulin suppressor-like RCC1 family protein